MKFLLRFSVLLSLIFTALSCFAQQKPAPAACSDQLGFPDADFSNFEKPITGKVRQVQLRITDKEVEPETTEIGTQTSSKPTLVKTLNYNEQGQITDTFLSDSKIKEFGKWIYSYDSENRRIGGTQINSSGAVLQEETYTYDDGKLTTIATVNPRFQTEKWRKQFTYPPDKNYVEMSDTREAYRFRFYKDAQCRIYEVSSYSLSREPITRVTVSYDDANKTAEETYYSPAGEVKGKRKSEFALDARGNWVRRRTYKASMVNGKWVYSETGVVKRTITYFDQR